MLVNATYQKFSTPSFCKVSNKANLSIISRILCGIDWKVAFTRCRHVDEYVHTFMDIFNSISRVEMCMGIGSAGFPSLPWDSHGNGNQIV